MTVVLNKNEIRGNLELFENYLCEGAEEEQIFCRELIKKGSCFVAYKINKELRFAPSRYIGYRDNSIESHKLRDKDGKETNAALNKVLGYKLSPDGELEKQYLKYCNSLGITPNNKKHKYWRFNVVGSDFSSNEKYGEEFPEGRIVERTHKARERNTKLIAAAKNEFIKKNKRLYCEACNFDFEKIYGRRGKGYIEAHHIIPVSDMKSSQKTKIEHIAMVCSNCHKILHRTRPWLSIKELKSLVKNET